MKRRWLVFAGVAIAIVVAGTGAVMAQSSGEDGEGRSLVERVAEKLGIDTTTLEDAIRDARSDQIDEAVAQGDLTQEEADELKEHLDELPAFIPGPGVGKRFEEGGWSPFPFGRDGDGPHPGFGFAFGLRGGADELAGFLGISTEQLRDELEADGATLATVAEVHGKSRDELKAFISENARERLADAVENDKLPQEKADAIAERLDEHLDDLVDSEFPRQSVLDAFPFPGYGHGGHFGFGFAFGVPGGIDDVAGFLNISADQLRDELEADGATLATVAEAHGKSRDELKVFIADDLEARLAEAVADGGLPQEKADAIAARLNEHLDELIDHEMPNFEGGRFEFHEFERVPDDEATPEVVPSGSSSFNF